jgi:Flp pilus assembly protein TadD
MERFLRPSALIVVAFGICAACAPAGSQDLNRASELFRDRRYSEAADTYRKAAGANPSWAAPHMGLGNALWETGDHDGALKAYRQAAALSPDWVEGQIALGRALVDSADWPEAVTVLERAVGLDRNAPEPRILLGVALTRLRRESEAVEQFRFALKLCSTCLDKRADDAYKEALSRLTER